MKRLTFDMLRLEIKRKLMIAAAKIQLQKIHLSVNRSNFILRFNAKGKL